MRALPVAAALLAAARASADSLVIVTELAAGVRTSLGTPPPNVSRAVGAPPEPPPELSRRTHSERSHRVERRAPKRAHSEIAPRTNDGRRSDPRADRPAQVPLRLDAAGRARHERDDVLLLRAVSHARRRPQSQSRVRAVRQARREALDLRRDAGRQGLARGRDHRPEDSRETRGRRGRAETVSTSFKRTTPANHRKRPWSLRALGRRRYVERQGRRRRVRSARAGGQGLSCRVE